MKRVDAVCIEFCKNYRAIDLEFKKNKPKEYDIAIIAIHLEEI